MIKNGLVQEASPRSDVVWSGALMAQCYTEATESICATDQQKPGLTPQCFFLLLKGLTHHADNKMCIQRQNSVQMIKEGYFCWF